MPYKDPEKRKAYHSAYIKKWNENNKEKRRAIGRAGMQRARDADPKKFEILQKQWRKTHPGYALKKVTEYKAKNPIKAKAHRIVLLAKKRGELIQKPCEVCGNTRSQAHHEDYRKPLAVIWLCQKHHSELHRKEK